MSKSGLYCKPTWLSQADFSSYLQVWSNPVIRCQADGCAIDNPDLLTVDHIVPRYQGGSDEISNLQPMCIHHNSSKGARNDRYWELPFFFDQTPNIDKFRSAQKFYAYGEVLNHKEWFGRDWSQICGSLMVLAWTVGAGKTLAIPALAFALNKARMEFAGTACRRVNRVLVLVKEEALRDQLARALESEISGRGITGCGPKVKTVTQGYRWNDVQYWKEADIVVACIQQFWDKKTEVNLPAILHQFPLIVFDEPHFADSQVFRIVDAAKTSLCFGLTGSPIKADGDLIKRFVLFSVFDYVEANRNDHSMRYLNEENKKRNEFVRVLDVENANVLHGVNQEHIEFPDVSEYPDYKKNIIPAINVANAVVEELFERSELRKRSIGEAAGHRVDFGNTSQIQVDLFFEPHAIIVAENIEHGEVLADSLNRKFNANRARYPEHDGWVAEVVYGEGEKLGGGRRTAKPMHESHPWLAVYRAKEAKKPFPRTWARILVAINIGREGLNNPLCCLIGIAKPTHSVLEVTQRAIGRQLRAYIEMRQGVLHVPPKELDSVRIITHAAYKNEDAINRGIQFTMNMREHLSGLQTLDMLIAGEGAPADSIDPDRPNLSLVERIEIAGHVGSIIEAGGDPGAPDAIEAAKNTWGGLMPDKREKVEDEIKLILIDPEKAYQKIASTTPLRALNDSELQALHVVASERVSISLSTEDVRRYVDVYCPHDVLFREILELLERRTAGETLDPGDDRSVSMLIRFCIEAKRSHMVIPPVMDTPLDTIRRQIAASIRTQLGGHYSGQDDQPIYQAVGIAVKKLLGVPNGDDENGRKWTAGNDSQFDTPAHRALLIRHDIRAQISGYVRDRMIRKGYCKALATAFGIATETE